jgi:hypothetical protein
LYDLVSADVLEQFRVRGDEPPSEREWLCEQTEKLRAAEDYSEALDQRAEDPGSVGTP